MERSKSPFPPAADVPLQRNPPLAPSQELAYRNKCIQLKKRLQEIETNNDQTRKRIMVEKDRIQKQRLLRSILLHQLREIMETPGRKFKPEDLERLGVPVNGNVDEDAYARRGRPEGEVLLDDSSEESDEDVPEPSDRPTRTRRQNNNYRGEAIINTSAPPMNQGVYNHPGLPVIAPASSYSPATAREPLLTSSFQTPVAAAAASGSPPAYSVSSQPQYVQESRFAGGPAHSSPIHTHAAIQSGSVHHPVQSQSRSTSLSQPVQSSIPVTEQNGYRAPAVPAPSIPQPVRPSPPYNQFCEHMRPQLEADNYPREHIQSRIDEEWRKLSSENRGLWEDRYLDQMREYEEQMDVWKRAQRTQAPGGSTYRR